MTMEPKLESFFFFLFVTLVINIPHLYILYNLIYLYILAHYTLLYSLNSFFFFSPSNFLQTHEDPMRRLKFVPIVSYHDANEILM